RSDHGGRDLRRPKLLRKIAQPLPGGTVRTRACDPEQLVDVGVPVARVRGHDFREVPDAAAKLRVAKAVHDRALRAGHRHPLRSPPDEPYASPERRPRDPEDAIAMPAELLLRLANLGRADHECGAEDLLG